MITPVTPGFTLTALAADILKRPMNRGVIIAGFIADAYIGFFVVNESRADEKVAVLICVTGFIFGINGAILGWKTIVRSVR